MLSASALLGTRIAAGVCLFVVANLVYAVLKLRRRMAAGTNWPRAAGTIVASSVSQSAAPRTGDDTATVEVRYRYRVGGRDYEGTRIRFGGQARMSALAADGIVAKYPRGAAIDVFYNPKSPSQAVLEPGNSGNLAALAVLLVVFVAISAVLIAHAIAGRVLYAANGAPLFAFLLPLFAIMIGVGSCVQYVLLRRQAAASATWPTVWGKITRAAVVAEEREDRDRDDGMIRTVTRYRPDVQFAYTVGGREFHGNTWTRGWTAYYPNEDGARAAIAKYSAGTSVPVFYNAMQPGEAVLEPDGGGFATSLVFGAMFGLGGLLMLWAFSVVPM